MLAETAETPPATNAAHRASFFRQSGWLMFANIVGGALMWGVHFLAKKIPPQEYGLFGTFLAVAMCVPTMPLQMVLAQQTAKALAANREPQLAGMIRLVWLGISALWLLAALFVLGFQDRILARWGVTNPAGLWVTLLVLLLALWLPLFQGILQGQQNFLWFGWSMMGNGIVRLLVAAVAVLALSSCAAGMMTGVLIGYGLGVGIALWQTRALWQIKSLPFDRASLLQQVVPLLLGFGAFQFLFTADTMFVKAYFAGDETGFYVSAGTLSRALMWLVGPLAAVMFPRIVHSAAKSEKSDLMGLVLLGTAVLAIGGALGLSILGPWVVKLIYGAKYVQVAAAVLPWYAGAMVPLALANVLLNNLLARSAFKVVAPLCLLAILYGVALTRFHATLVQVLQTLGVCNLAMFLLCAWFTWQAKERPTPAA